MGQCNGITVPHVMPITLAPVTYRLKDADQKHSSVVAKVHYQKRRSREVAERAHKCPQKLQGLQVDEEVNTRFGNLSSSLQRTID